MSTSAPKQLRPQARALFKGLRGLMTQDEVAAHLRERGFHVERSTISRWFSGEYAMPAGALHTIFMELDDESLASWLRVLLNDRAVRVIIEEDGLGSSSDSVGAGGSTCTDLAVRSLSLPESLGALTHEIREAARDGHLDAGELARIRTEMNALRAGLNELESLAISVAK